VEGLSTKVLDVVPCGITNEEGACRQPSSSRFRQVHSGAAFAVLRPSRTVRHMVEHATSGSAVWQANLSEVRAHVERTGQLPRWRKYDPGERRLANWVAIQQRRHRAGSLTIEQRHACERIPGWAWTQGRHRSNRAMSEVVRAAVASYVTRTGTTLMRPGLVWDGVGVAAACATWRRELHDPRPDTPLARWLEGLPGWSFAPVSVEERVRFALCHPEHADLVASRAERTQVSVSFRRGWRHGTLDPALVAEVGSVPGWRWPETERGDGSRSSGVRRAALEALAASGALPPLEQRILADRLAGAGLGDIGAVHGVSREAIRLRLKRLSALAEDRYLEAAHRFFHLWGLWYEQLATPAVPMCWMECAEVVQLLAGDRARTELLAAPRPVALWLHLAASPELTSGHLVAAGAPARDGQ
jgi:hypothetical protein